MCRAILVTVLPVSPVQTAGPDGRLDGAGEDPAGQGGRGHLDHGLDLGLAHTAPVGDYARRVPDTDHSDNSRRAVALQTLPLRAEGVRGDGVSRHLQTVGQEDVSFSHEDIGESRELSCHLGQHAL